MTATSIAVLELYTEDPVKSCLSAVEYVGFPPILFTPDAIVLVDGREEMYT
jgi:hypothetical protein